MTPPFKGGQGRSAREVRDTGAWLCVSWFLVWALVLVGWLCWLCAQLGWWRR